MATEIQLRRDTAANWTTANPVLGQGEAGYEFDTHLLKIGDGVTHWSSLPYFVTGAAVDTVDTPTPDTHSGTPGTNVTAASSNHAHPLSRLYAAARFQFPPSYNNLDFTLDGTWSGQESTFSYGYLGVQNYGFFTHAGSTYTMDATSPPVFYCRNFAVDAGITLKPQIPGGAVVIVASEAITVAGTIDCTGPAASGNAGGGGFSSSATQGYGGYQGANGGTGAGTPGFDGSNCTQVGGPGGAGGSSGATAGGVASGYGVIPWMQGENMIWLLGHYFPFTHTNNNVPGGANGGSGGSAGAGDGTNNGGGGGGGGGIVLLIAPTITIAATAALKTVGGAGAVGTGGNAGGGGGGGGGGISLQALSLSIAAGSTFATGGGAGGAGAGTGAAGSAGQSSKVIADPSTSIGGFGLGAGVLACQWL